MKIKASYSSDCQDLFVFFVTKKTIGGTYVEIGSGHPTKGNNTYMLEMLGWNGISVEIRESMVDLFLEQRKNPCVCADAVTLNYESLLNPSLWLTRQGNYDYLQIDCNPPATSFKALKKIPLALYKFSVITFEHDFYRHCKKSASNHEYVVKQQSREYLRGFGYILVADNISSRGRPFEDWYVHPDLIPQSMIKRINRADGTNKEAKDYVYDILMKD